MKTQKKPETVADLEARTGKPDSIRNSNGSNSRSDKQVKTLEKQLKTKVKDFVLPDKMPIHLELKYDDYSSFFVGEGLKQAMIVLNAFGLIK